RPGIPPHRLCGGTPQGKGQTPAAWSLHVGAVGDRSTPHQTRSGGGPGKGFLADTRRSNRGRVSRELQMPEDLPDHLAVRDGGDGPQRPLLIERAAHHVKSKDALANHAQLQSALIVPSCSYLPPQILPDERQPVPSMQGALQG